jgi:hypothetical protein
MPPCPPPPLTEADVVVEAGVPVVDEDAFVDAPPEPPDGSGSSNVYSGNKHPASASATPAPATQDLRRTIVRR